MKQNKDIDELIKDVRRVLFVWNATKGPQFKITQPELIKNLSAIDYDENNRNNRELVFTWENHIFVVRMEQKDTLMRILITSYTRNEYYPELVIRDDRPVDEYFFLMYDGPKHI